MKRPIRVLHVLEATVGGTRRHVVSLVAGLDKTRFTAEVAAPMMRHGTINDTSFVEEIRAIGVTLHSINMYREIRPFADLKALFSLIRLIRQNHYDIIHTHSSKAGFLGRMAAFVNRCPVVYTPNGFYFLDTGHFAKKQLFIALERLAGLFTWQLIVVSPSEQKTAFYYHIAAPERTTLIPNAVDISQFTPCPTHRTRTALGIEPGTAVLGTVSRYISQKDPLTMIRAIRLVADQYPQFCFLWCGEGELRQPTEQLATELGLSTYIQFLGFRPDIQTIMNTFDIFVLSSIFEGLPYTLLEAMSLAKPIVATNVIGSQDVVIDGVTGLLVPPQDPHALAQAILTLLQQPEHRLQMGISGRQRVINHFSLDQMVRETETIYDRLVKPVYE